MTDAMTDEDLEWIRGAAETRQWADDSTAATWLLQLLAEVDRLREVEALALHAAGKLPK